MPVVDVGDLGGPAVASTDEEGAWLARWSDHPGAARVRDVYRRHRRARASRSAPGGSDLNPARLQE